MRAAPCGLRDTVIGVPAELHIEPISPEQVQVLLPLIGAYQRFYEVEEIDEERNRAFFSRFLAPSAPGNQTAQRLNDSTGAERSEWVEYELRLD